MFDERDIVNGNYEVIGNRIYELEPIIEADRRERQGQMLKPLFCEECGITEMQPMYMQRYCRYCGAKIKEMSE